MNWSEWHLLALLAYCALYLSVKYIYRWIFQAPPAEVPGKETRPPTA